MTRIAAAQMCSTPDRSRNLEQAEALLIEAVRQDAQCVAFPENFTLLTEDRESILSSAETSMDGPVISTVRDWARQHGIWLLAGSLPVRAPKDDHHVSNTSLLIDPDGSVAARYDKIHLFDVALSEDRSYRESENIRPGSTPTAVTTALGRVGLTICYDLRFPELFRALSSAEPVDLFFIPAAFTRVTGRAHWDPLTRARAIENLAYVVAPTQCGLHYEGRETHGHTRIIDPWGRVLAERPADPGIVIADFDPAVIEKARREIPALQHRKLR